MEKWRNFQNTEIFMIFDPYLAPRASHRKFPRDQSCSLLARIYASPKIAALPHRIPELHARKVGAPLQTSQV